MQALTPIILACAVAAAFIAWVICANAHAIADALKVIDFPDPVGGRKRHDHATPLVGGIAVLPVVVGLGFVAPLLIGAPESVVVDLRWIGVVVLGIFVIGFCDDRSQLKPALRLLMSLIAMAMLIDFVPGAIISYFYFSFLSDTLFVGVIAVPFTLLCLIGLINAVNMADGKNGLVIGLSLLWTVLVWIYADAALYPLLAALVSALAVALFFNMSGKLFLGDAGSYGLAALIGFLAVMTYGHGVTGLYADQIALWFLIPVLDCLRLMLSRHLDGRSPFAGDRNHLHHYLASVMPWRWGLAVYLGMVAIPSIVSVFWPAATLPIAILTAALYFVVIFALARPRVEATAPFA